MNNIVELTKECRTYRRFQQKQVSDEIISQMLEAARFSASGRNAQPLSYIVAKSGEMVEKIFPCTKWAAALPPEEGTPKNGERPVLYIAVIINTDIPGTQETDAGIAIQSMSLAAMENGVGRCILGAIDRKELGKLFGLKETQKIHSLVAFGYPSHKSSIEDMDVSGSCSYHLDENRDYIVPKRRLEDVVKYI